jgi:hypothetical protein
MDPERRNAIRRFLLEQFARAIGAPVRWFRRIRRDGTPEYVPQLPPDVFVERGELPAATERLDATA